MKMADRKAFNFYKSHWEQIKLLSDPQRLDLFNAICQVQFLEESIDDIHFKDAITNLVWTGIKHSIATSLNGFINKQKALDKDIEIPLSKGLIPPLGKGGIEVLPKEGAQQEKGEEQEKEEEKEKGELQKGQKPLKSPSRRKPPPKKMNLKFPYSSNEFMKVWNGLIETPKWKKKIEHALQISLDKLGKYEEPFAIELIERAISGNYQGVVFPDTDEAYQKWKKRKHSNNQSNEPSIQNPNGIWKSRNQ